MKHNLIVPGLFALGLLVSLSLTGTADAGRISAKKLKDHVTRLSSDDFEGRGTGERGIVRAEEYIAREFASYGLLPVPGHSDFYLPFDLYRAQFDPEATKLRLDRADGSLRETRLVGDEFRVFPFSDGGAATAEVVFAGYGISAPNWGYDDYSELEVDGKFVLVLRHEPGERDPNSIFDGVDSSPHALFTSKAEAARSRGALGMLLVTDPLHHSEADDFRTGGQLYLETERAMEPIIGRGQAEDDAQPPFLAIQISRGLANQILSPSGRGLLDVQREIDDQLRPVQLDLQGTQVSLEIGAPEDVRIIPARNVAGFLEGSDPKLRDEWIVLGAHHDHLGSFEGHGDTVYNGADDNASGTSAILQIAEELTRSKQRPRRSIVFTTFSGEERGLLGSRAMVEQEQIDIDKVVFMCNFDMIGRNPQRPMTLMGDGFSRGLDALLEDILSDFELEVALSGMAYQGNSDHDSFFDADIPFLNFFSGLHDDYHQLSDHVSYLDFDRMERIVKLGHRLTRELADRETRFELVHHLSWLGVLAEVKREAGEAIPYFSEVDEESRAWSAGFRPGDVIRKIGEEPVAPAEEIGTRLRAVEPGTAVTIEIERSGSIDTIDVERARAGYLGIFPAPVEEETRKKFGLKSNEGVLARQVVADGPAADSGLKSGDLILQVAGRLVDASSLRGVLAQIGAWETVDVVIIRSGERMNFPLTLGERPRRG